jgi:hypothetical protein
LPESPESKAICSSTVEMHHGVASRDKVEFRRTQKTATSHGR